MGSGVNPTKTNQANSDPGAAKVRSDVVQLLTEDQVADALSVVPRHVRNLRARGLIPYVQLGRSIRYSAADVNGAIAQLTIR